jgi:ABC-type uncharacterized transport system auxiliary subunit
MTHPILRKAALAAMAAGALFLAGCAAPAHKENMSVASIPATKKHPFSVRVETRGGPETGVMDSSNVGNAELKAAIEESITKSSLFKSVVQGAGGDYHLSVSVTQLDKPLFGASFTVTLETAWTLVRTRDNAVVLRKAVRAAHTASMGDSLVGATRLRLALEGAVRANIQQGLQAVAEAPL